MCEALRREPGARQHLRLAPGTHLSVHNKIAVSNYNKESPAPRHLGSSHDSAVQFPPPGHSLNHLLLWRSN